LSRDSADTEHTTPNQANRNRETSTEQPKTKTENSPPPAHAINPSPSREHQQHSEKTTLQEATRNCCSASAKTQIGIAYITKQQKRNLKQISAHVILPKKEYFATNRDSFPTKLKNQKTNE
jgi:hypothetical protein